MIVTLLIATFIIALAVASLVALIFARPIAGIMARVVPGDISSAWTRYLIFAIYVFGIGGGVRIFDFEKYLTPIPPTGQVTALTADRWTLEIYQTIIGTLQSTATMLLVFFVFALIAVVIIRFAEIRAQRTESTK